MARARTVALVSAGRASLRFIVIDRHRRIRRHLRIERARQDARRRDAPCRHLSTPHRRQVSGVAATHALQQGWRRRVRTEGRGTRLRRDHSGRARPLRVRGRVVHVQARGERWLRYGGVGGGTAVFRWQSGHVRWLLRRRDADARGDRASAASGRHLSVRDGEQLPLELDLPGRRVSAVVQRVLDVRPGAERVQSRRQQPHERDEKHLATAAGLVCPVQRPRWRRSTRLDQIACAVLPRLARASERGRVLEAVVHRGALLGDHRPAADDCRLVRHLPGRVSAGTTWA